MKTIIETVAEEWISDPGQKNLMKQLMYQAEREDKLLKMMRDMPEQETVSNLKHIQHKIQDLLRAVGTLSREKSHRSGNGSIVQGSGLLAK